MDTPLVSDLRAALAPDRVRVNPLELDLYARDASVISGRAEVVCFPLTTEEVQAAVRVSRAHGRPFVPRGSGTGLAGGAVPVGDPVVIVTTKMTRVLSVDADDRMAWVEPGRASGWRTASTSEPSSAGPTASTTPAAAPWAAAHYGLTVLAEGLEDRPDNATTFVLLRRRVQ